MITIKLYICVLWALFLTAIFLNFSSFLIHEFLISMHFSVSYKHFIDLSVQEQRIGNLLSDFFHLSECLSITLAHE